jgi:hypothetical protein
MPCRRPLSLEDRTKTIGGSRIDASDLLQERLSCEDLVDRGVSMQIEVMHDLEP